MIKNNYRSPAASKELNKYISKITITNSFHQTNNGTTDGTTPNFAYTKEVSTGDIRHTKQKNISIIPNGTTIYSNTIPVGHHRKKNSNLSTTHNDITTIDMKNNKAIPTQNNIQYSDSYSSVRTTTDSDKSFHNLPKKGTIINA